MKTCPHCHIQVGGDTGYCPLCQNRLHGEQGSPWFPPTAPRIHRASLFYKIVAFVVLRRRFNGPRQIFNLLLLVSALIVFTDWFTGYTGYSLDLVVPILCSVTLVCNFIFAFLHSRFTANALVYLLMNIGVGLLPYILLFFRIDRGRIDGHSIPWVNCLIISVVTFLGLVIFKGRDLRSEIAKRLHL